MKFSFDIGCWMLYWGDILDITVIAVGPISVQIER